MREVSVADRIAWSDTVEIVATRHALLPFRYALVANAIGRLLARGADGALSFAQVASHERRGIKDQPRPRTVAVVRYDRRRIE